MSQYRGPDRWRKPVFGSCSIERCVAQRGHCCLSMVDGLSKMVEDGWRWLEMALAGFRGFRADKACEKLTLELLEIADVLNCDIFVVNYQCNTFFIIIIIMMMIIMLTVVI